MKVITLWQPWATLMVIGAKRIETRGWQTHHRGEILIASSKSIPASYRAADERLALSASVQSALREFRPDVIDAWGEPFPGGAILGRVELMGCRRTDARSEWEPLEGFRLPLPPREGANEFSFGDYSPGRWMWLTENAEAFREPIPVPPGCHQRVWNWEPPR